MNLGNRNKKEKGEGCSPVIEEEAENALLDYADAAEVTTTGKYRCRDCGMLFDTLEEHDEHHREVHRYKKTYPVAGMTM